MSEYVYYKDTIVSFSPDWHLAWLSTYHVYVPCLIFIGTTFLGILSIYQWIFRRIFKWREIYAFTLSSIEKNSATKNK